MQLTLVNESPWLHKNSNFVITCGPLLKLFGKLVLKRWLQNKITKRTTCWQRRASSCESLKHRVSCNTAPFSIPQKGENSMPSSESSSLFLDSGSKPCAFVSLIAPNKAIQSNPESIQSSTHAVGRVHAKTVCRSRRAS